jgi:hypothetical protein
MKAAGRAFLTGPPETVGTFSAVGPAAENGIFKEHLVKGRELMGRRKRPPFFFNYFGIGE